MPAVIELVCCRSGGKPERQQANDKTEEVHQQVGSVCHHRKTACKVPSCRQTMFGVSEWAKRYVLEIGSSKAYFKTVTKHNDSPRISPIMKSRQMTEATYNLFLATFFSCSRVSCAWLLSWQCLMPSVPSIRGGSWSATLKAHLISIKYTLLSDLFQQLDYFLYMQPMIFIINVVSLF